MSSNRIGKIFQKLTGKRKEVVVSSAEKLAPPVKQATVGEGAPQADKEAQSIQHPAKGRLLRTERVSTGLRHNDENKPPQPSQTDDSFKQLAEMEGNKGSMYGFMEGEKLTPNNRKTEYTEADIKAVVAESKEALQKAGRLGLIDGITKAMTPTNDDYVDHLRAREKPKDHDAQVANLMTTYAIALGHKHQGEAPQEYKLTQFVKNFGGIDSDAKANQMADFMKDIANTVAASMPKQAATSEQSQQPKSEQEEPPRHGM